MAQVRHDRLAVGLCASAVVACLLAGAVLTQVPIMSNRRYPELLEVVSMIAVPTDGAIIATWGAWRNRPRLVILGTALLGIFSLVTGFSIGRIFLPALAFLVWGTFTAFSNTAD